MREFVYYSRSAVTAGNMIRDNLMDAGRMDIVCNVVISVFFISNKMRDDVKLHLIFDGPPNAPRHLVLESNEEMPISKKNVAGLIKRMLYKAKDEEGLREICPGCFIERKGFESLVKELDGMRPLRCETTDVVRTEQGSCETGSACETAVDTECCESKNVLLLDGKGVDVREVDLDKAVFIIGDHEGFPADKKKFLKSIDKVSVGPKVLFASQVITVLHNEVDRKS